MAKFNAPQQSSTLTPPAAATTTNTRVVVVYSFYVRSQKTKYSVVIVQPFDAPLFFPLISKFSILARSSMLRMPTAYACTNRQAYRISLNQIYIGQTYIAFQPHKYIIPFTGTLNRSFSKDTLVYKNKNTIAMVVVINDFLFHGNLRAPPQGYPPQEIRPPIRPQERETNGFSQSLNKAGYFWWGVGIGWVP